jgi:putative two-component system response regulator
LTDELDTAESVLYTLARTIEAKDRYTLGHADRVAGYAMELGRRLGVNADDLRILRKGGMLHDIGKLAIPDSILTKPGKFTPDEFGVMKRHPLLGCDICEKLKTVKDALPIIRHHHEKLDGTGYPDGLKGASVPPLVRIVTIVDIYDALRSKRSYKDAFSIDKTFEIMWEEVEKGWWDRDIVTAWEKAVSARNTDPFPSF